MLDRLLSALLGVPFLLGAAAAPDLPGEVLFRFQDPAIVEASALVVTTDGLVVTSNDSGDTGRVFAVDPASGETVGVTRWADAPTDVEALAPGPEVDGGATVWVGDIGDNTASRDTVQVAQVPIGRGDRTVHPTVYDLAYPDGAHDAETLVRDPTTGRLYVASKGVLGGTLYAAPARLVAGRVNRLTAVGPVLSIATDGAFLPDGKHLVIRGYASATVYDWPSLAPVGSVRLPAQPQGEGLGIGPDGEVLLDSEGLHSAVLRVRLPSGLTFAPPPSHPPSDTAHPAPTGSPPGAAASGTPARAGGTSGAGHTTYWALGAGVLVVGLLAAGAGTLRRRRSAVE